MKTINHKDLITYQLALEVYKATEAVSIPSNIAEGYRGGLRILSTMIKKMEGK